MDNPHWTFGDKGVDSKIRTSLYGGWGRLFLRHERLVNALSNHSEKYLIALTQKRPIDKNSISAFDLSRRKCDTTCHTYDPIVVHAPHIRFIFPSKRTMNGGRTVDDHRVTSTVIEGVQLQTGFMKL